MDLLAEYDHIYEKADNLFKEYNPCQFVDDLCVNNRYNNYSELQINGCCGTRSKPCEHFGSKGCAVKALGCKLHICFYVSQTKAFNKLTAELAKLERRAVRLLPGFKIDTRMTRSDYLILLKGTTKRT